jgi:hypothetical protein
VLPPQAVTVEKPATRSLRIGTTVTLDDQGGAVLRRAATGLLGPGRELVVRVSVR